MIGTANALLQHFETTLVRVAAALLFILMVLVSGDVVMRYLFNQPLSWSYDIVSLYLMPALFYLALAPTLTAGAHIGIDILHYRMPVFARRVCQVIIGLLSAALFVYIAILGAVRAWGEYASDASVVSEFGWKTWISVAFVPLGSGLVALRLVLNAVAHAIALLGGPDTIGLPPLAGRSALVGGEE